MRTGGVLQKLLRADVLPECPVALVPTLRMNRCVGRPFHRGLRDVPGPQEVSGVVVCLRQSGSLGDLFYGIADGATRDCIARNESRPWHTSEDRSLLNGGYGHPLPQSRNWTVL